MHDSNNYINKAPVQWPEDREGQDVTELIKSMFKEKTERLLLWHWIEQRSIWKALP